MTTKYRIIKTSEGGFYSEYRSFFIWWNIRRSCSLEVAKRSIEVHKEGDTVVYSE